MGGDVEFAEPNMVGGLLADFGFHAWPDGPPATVAGGQAAWTGQPATTALRLAAAQAVSRGRGVQVAVIDTGVAVGHPTFAGRARSGGDFVDDDGNAEDSNCDGVPDEAAGHGTFVAGTIALVAPEARLVAYRALDSDGQGTTYDAAQALIAAADAGAKVINHELRDAGRRLQPGPRRRGRLRAGPWRRRGGRGGQLRRRRSDLPGRPAGCAVGGRRER